MSQVICCCLLEGERRTTDDRPQMLQATMRQVIRLCLLGLVLIVVGCSEPAREIVGTTSDGQFELVLRADLNWVRPSATLLVELLVRRLDPLAQLGPSDRISFVVNNGTVSPSSVTPSFAPALGDTVEKQVYQTWLEFKAPGSNFGSSTVSGEQQGEIHALFRALRTTLKVRIVPNLGS